LLVLRLSPNAKPLSRWQSSQSIGLQNGSSRVPHPGGQAESKFVNLRFHPEVDFCPFRGPGTPCAHDQDALPSGKIKLRLVKQQPTWAALGTFVSEIFGSVSLLPRLH
jgi:hypothetical protein